MLELVLPKIKCDVKTKKYGRFIIEPLESGYGLTVGNALRRVLLSSLPGAAVTSLKISDVYHEFRPIPGVREDMMNLILNVKQLRFKLDSDGPVRLHLKVKGEGDVTAGDLECPSGVELINPGLHICTIDSPDTELDLELTVETGRGYSPADERGKLPIGEIAVDAIFSPIRKVNYDVERARVGQVTNFDRLIMEIWTDGTIEADEALKETAKILDRHFSLISGVEKIEVEAEVEEEAIPSRIYEMAIEELDLSTRVFNCLKRTGISQVGEVLERLEKGDDGMLKIRNFGEKSLVELKQKLQARDLLPRRIHEIPIEELDLSMRVFNCLRRAGISRVGEVLERLKKGDEEMLAIKDFGEKSLAELKEKLRARGLLSEEESE